MELDVYLPESLRMFMDDPKFHEDEYYSERSEAYAECSLHDAEIEEAGGFMDDFFLRMWIEEHPEYKDLLIVEPKMTEEEWKELFEDVKQFTLELELPIKGE